MLVAISGFTSANKSFGLINTELITVFISHVTLRYICQYWCIEQSNSAPPVSFKHISDNEHKHESLITILARTLQVFLLSYGFDSRTLHSQMIMTYTELALHHNELITCLHTQ